MMGALKGVAGTALGAEKGILGSVGKIANPKETARNAFNSLKSSLGFNVPTTADKSLSETAKDQQSFN